MWTKWVVAKGGVTAAGGRYKGVGRRAVDAFISGRASKARVSAALKCFTALDRTSLSVE